VGKTEIYGEKPVPILLHTLLIAQNTFTLNPELRGERSVTKHFSYL